MFVKGYLWGLFDLNDSAAAIRANFADWITFGKVEQGPYCVFSVPCSLILLTLSGPVQLGPFNLWSSAFCSAARLRPNANNAALCLAYVGCEDREERAEGPRAGAISPPTPGKPQRDTTAGSLWKQ